MPDLTTTNTLWLVGLSSAAISAVVSGIVVGLFNLRAKRNEFVNEYHKVVVQRRIAAYESLEKLIILIKTVVLDPGDNRPYHLIFSQENPQQTVYERLFELMLHGLWLSNKAFEKTREFNLLMFSLLDDKDGVVEFGKTNHQAIAR